MFARIHALIVKEFLAVWQDKKSRFVLVVPPIIQLFIFAFAATLDVTNASIGILNRDSGKEAYELTQRFQGSPIFKHVKYLKSDEEIKKAIDTQEVMMVIHIDEQFSRKVLSKQPATVQFILDGRKSNTAQIVEGYALSIVDQYNRELAAKMGQPSPNTYLVPRNWFNPNLIYTWFTVPGLIGILTTLLALLLTAQSVAREKELGTFEQLLVTPLTPTDILIGKTVPAIVLACAVELFTCSPASSSSAFPLPAHFSPSTYPCLFSFSRSSASGSSSPPSAKPSSKPSSASSSSCLLPLLSQALQPQSKICPSGCKP